MPAERIARLIKNEWLPFKAAMQFLTRIPMGKAEQYDAEVFNRSLLWYPVVGLAIGLLLQLLVLVLPYHTFGFFNAALVLCAWVFLTGALHLDGLADVADAWVGGMGDRQRTLDIMKDPRSGPMAVVVLLLTLLLKLAALAVLFRYAYASYIWVVPVIARSAILPAFLWLPYVRRQGLGSFLTEQSGSLVGGVLLVDAVLLWLFMPGMLWLVWLLVAAAVFLLWRRTMLERLQGFTGDSVGALVELIETILLVAAVLLAAAQ